MNTPRSGIGAPIKRLREDHSIGAQNEGARNVTAPPSNRRRMRSTTATNKERIELSNDVS